jgi:hypothetical protein
MSPERTDIAESRTLSIGNEMPRRHFSGRMCPKRTLVCDCFGAIDSNPNGTVEHDMRTMIDIGERSSVAMNYA